MMDSTETNRRRKKITGFHATMMFIAFFGVIMTVNFLMAGLAIGTFGGTVVDNSYVASQKYNDWLAEGRNQEAYGWNIAKPVRVDDRLEILALAAEGRPLASATVTAIAEHPVGRTDAFNLTFEEIEPGKYQSREPLPAGRWKLKI
ncbi:Type cbb3 cytochrome oxidase biogenesis protein CcoH, partial [hydrothermal vent metagenome]